MAKKTNAAKDWTKEYIKYRICEMFGSMTAMAHCYGLHQSVIPRAIRVPYPKVERIIAKGLGVTPEEIWPSRYNRNELVSNPRLWRRWINVKVTTDDVTGNVSSEGTN
jgi:Ner family transcriptional regulator